MRNWRHTWESVPRRLCRHTCYFCKSFFLVFEWLLIHYMDLGFWSKMFYNLQFSLNSSCYECCIAVFYVSFYVWMWIFKYLFLFEKCFQKPIFLYMCSRYKLLVYCFAVLYMLSLSPILFYICHWFLQRHFVFYICINEVFRLCLLPCHPYPLIFILSSKQNLQI